MKSVKGRFIIVIIFLAGLGAGAVAFVTAAVFFREAPANAVEQSRLVERGQILDRNGEILAIQRRQKNLTIWKPNMSLAEDSIALLAELFRSDATALAKRIESGANYQRLFRELDAGQIEAVMNYRKEGRLKGIYLEDSLDRFYPLGSLASHVLGFTDHRNIGMGGLEQGLDELLYPAGSNFHSGHGNTLTLTIDQNIQYYTEEIAEKAMNENDADSVIFIVMDARNGEILAMTSRPTYNPNELNRASSRSLANLSAVYAYEPGSVFKIFSIGAALDSGLIDRSTQFFCNGKYEIATDDGKKIAINCLGHHGYQNFSQVIENSCNAGTASAIEPMDNYNFYQRLKDFGFGEPVGLSFPYENPGILSRPKRWSLRSKPTIAIGQEILTTALQLTTAATVYTNNGKLLRPHLLRKVERPDGTLMRQYHREPLRQVIQEETAREILLAMEQNTLAGTGKRALVDGIKISTKTGTAQMIDKVSRKYSEEAFFASCLAILPTDDPQIILYGGINHPKGESTYGGVIVTPLIQQLAKECIYQFSLTRESDIEIETDAAIRRAENNILTLGPQMPDLTGMAKRDLMQLFGSRNQTVTIKGNGWVVRQLPAAGTELTGGEEIILELE